MARVFGNKDLPTMATVIVGDKYVCTLGHPSKTNILVHIWGRVRVGEARKSK